MAAAAGRPERVPGGSGYQWREAGYGDADVRDGTWFEIYGGILSIHTLHRTPHNPHTQVPNGAYRLEFSFAGDVLPHNLGPPPHHVPSFKSMEVFWDGRKVIQRPEMMVRLIRSHVIVSIHPQQPPP